MPLLNEVLANKYRLVRKIGQGGMGEVYEAKHEGIGKRVAVKLVNPELSDDQVVVARFTREAEAAAAIGHPCIIDIHDIGKTQDGSLFLVMEYLEGQNLRALMNESQWLEIPFASYIICQVLGALAAAHGAGVIHRDLKPDNIFLVDSGQQMPGIKLLDFGISKIIDDGKDTQMTRSGVIMGSPLYIPPEQAQGMRNVDHRADIYAAGVILYEALTGRRPFSGENLMGVLLAILSHDPDPPSLIRPEVTPELEQVVACAMLRDRDRRYQSAVAMLTALLPFVDEHGRGHLALGKVLGDLSLPAIARPSSVGEVVDTPATMYQSESRPNLPATMYDSSPGAEQPPATMFESSPGAVNVTPPGIATDMAWQSTISSTDSMVLQPKRRTGLLAGIVVVLAILLLGGVGALALVLMTEQEEAQVAAPPATPDEENVDAVAASPVTAGPPSTPVAPVPGVTVEAASIESPGAEASSMVVVTVEGVPRDAVILLDGAPVEGHRIERSRSSDTHEVRVELEGHETWRRDVTFERNSTFYVAMQERSRRHDRERDSREESAERTEPVEPVVAEPATPIVVPSPTAPVPAEPVVEQPQVLQPEEPPPTPAPRPRPRPRPQDRFRNDFE